MCGFVAVFNTEAGSRVELDALRDAVSALTHRGPDGAGVAVLAEGRVGLAHARLSVIDLQGGAQPLFNEDRSISAVVNGELYDYGVHRSELEAKGHRFRTRSDSELVVHLYEEHGDDLVHRLNGEFAFVLWDGRKQRLLAARDPMGVKPLYYAATSNGIVLASEAKAILAYGAVPRGMRPDYVVGALFGVPNAHASPFTGIDILGPGHSLTVVDGRVHTRERWFVHRFAPAWSGSFDGAAEQLRETLRSAVRRRLIADVPVHVYLSGGLDSTLVAALMAEAGARPTAYTVSFAGTDLDESAAARATADFYGFPLEVIDANPDALAEHLPRAIYHCESVIGNLNSVAKMLLAGHVRARGVKVCLTGEGADELFCGYAYWKLEALVAMRARGGAAAVEAKPLFARMMTDEKRNQGLTWSRWTAKASTNAPFGYPSYVQRHVDGLSPLAPYLLAPDVIRGAGRTPSAMLRETLSSDELRALHPVNASRRIAFEMLAAYVIPNLGDRMEMANGIECRTPFLDRDMIAFATALDPELLVDVRQLREKRILYEAFKQLLPPHVYATKKHPFMSPGWRAFGSTRRGRELVDALLTREAVEAAGMFNPRTVAAIRAAWNVLPASLPQATSLDFAMGGLLSMQLVQHLLVAHPPQVAKLTDLEDRSHEVSRNLFASPVAVTSTGSKLEPRVAAQLASLPDTAPLTAWDLFVVRHRKRGNHVMHFLSALMFFGGPLVAVVQRNPWYMLLFFASGGMGTLGHYMFRDGVVSVREATATPNVPRFVLKMFWLLGRGQYQSQVDLALTKMSAREH